MNSVTAVATHGRGRLRRSTRLFARLVLTLLVALTITGCGSQLDPSAVASADAGVAGAPVPVDTPGAIPSESSGIPSADVPEGSVSGAPDDETGTGPEPTAPTAPGDRTPAGPGSSDPPAVPQVKAGSCAGFRDQTGIDSHDITIANASDISGPVPGIFESTQDAVEAYAAYFNATSSICGRQLKVMPIDTRTDAGGDQQAYVTACSDAFATVGSMAAFDSGGAPEAQSCGLPDIRSAIVNGARNACDTCFAAQSGTPNTSANAVPDYLLRTYHDAATHAGYLYIEAGPAVENATDEIKAWQQRGMKFSYTQGIGVSEFNYVPYVEALKEHGVQLVRFLGSSDEAVRLARTMTQQDYHPDVFLIDATAYDQNYVDSGGADVNGTRVFVNFTPFEDAHSNPELSLYLRWLQAVKPGATPTYEGLFAWSAARLFTEQATELGGHLTRAALVKRLEGVEHWTDHGMHAPQQVGSHVVGPCWRFLRLENGHWVPEGGTDYRCGSVTTVH